MDCAQEVSILRARLSSLRGVRDLSFDIFQGRMTVQFDTALTSEEEIESAVSGLGMRCLPWSEAQGKQPGHANLWQRPGFLVWCSGIALTAGLFWHAAATGEFLETLLTHGHAMETSGHAHKIPAGALALYLIAVITGAIRIVPRAVGAIRQRQMDMNALVVVSVIGASVLGEWVEAATLSFLFALAGRLESWSLERARDAITRLLRVAPLRAVVLHAGHEHDAPVEHVVPGSLVRVEMGARIPFDGVVEQGTSYVNQALVTGESVAVEKSAGSNVYAGTLNEDAPLLIRTTREAADTVLARMIRMVESSQTRRAHKEQMIERFALRYTPIVLALAIAVAVVPPLLGRGSWGEWVYQGMVILLVACPCALVISTPVTLMAALTSAAKAGVLVKGSSFLEEASRVKLLVLPEEQNVGAPPPEGVRMEVLADSMSGEERAGRVEDLQRSNRGVAYLGGSMLDTEALNIAGIGISTTAPGSDFAQESADVVLLRGRSDGVRFLIQHARRTMRVIASNIGIAVGLKLLFLGLASMGKATLWMAVASDMGATLLVTFNGLRLLRASKIEVRQPNSWVDSGSRNLPSE